MQRRLQWNGSSKMRIELMIIILFTIFIIVAGAMLIIVLLKKQNDSSKVILLGGMDIDTQKKGRDLSKQFLGILDSEDTWHTKRGSAQTHSLIFTDLLTREQYVRRFRNRMGIGRASYVRGAEAFLSISGDSYLSRIQCWLTDYNGQIYVENVSKSTPLFLDENEVTGPHVVKNNAVIRAGNTRLRVQFGGGRQ